MKNVKRNTLLTYLAGNYNVESNVNSDRIYELNNQPEFDGPVVYLCERELRQEDNFALNFAYEKSDDVKVMYSPRGIKTLNPGMVVVDFYPLRDYSYLNQLGCRVYEVDSHNIVPARIASDKQEYSAATFRRKIYYLINNYLTEYPEKEIKNRHARKALDDFIKNRLDYYAEYRNDPSKDMVSGLSKYLCRGFISSQRAVLEVLKTDTADENKEEFLEEIIIRKELADNFCFYNKNFKSFEGAPNWAKETLLKHKDDFRQHIFSLEELENAKTYDRLWNATQKQLIKEGRIHGYLRMYWAKKILEWTPSPQKAVETAVYLNDKYALDAPSENGYTGILWAIAGLHDRGFSERDVTGKIRQMTYKGIKSKYNIDEYILKKRDQPALCE